MRFPAQPSKLFWANNQNKQKHSRDVGLRGWGALLARISLSDFSGNICRVNVVILRDREDYQAKPHCFTFPDTLSALVSQQPALHLARVASAPKLLRSSVSLLINAGVVMMKGVYVYRVTMISCEIKRWAMLKCNNDILQ